jgi:ureidoglycolate lyase
MIALIPQALTREAFAPFGDLVDIEGHEYRVVNQGFAKRFGDLAGVDVSAEGGSATVNIFIAQQRPAEIALMERHPLGSQMFFPLQDKPWLVVVCGDPLDAGSYYCFQLSGKQGVNYRRNVWHHPVIALGPDSRFLVVDRRGPGNNLVEVAVPVQMRLAL